MMSGRSPASGATSTNEKPPIARPHLQKKFPKHFSPPPKPPVHSPHPVTDTPQGVAAKRGRRWGWRGNAAFPSSGSSSNPPGGNGRRTGRRFRTGWRSSPDARPGRIDKRRCEQRLSAFDPSVRNAPPGVPTAHRLMVENACEIEAKFRRYTGTRCICPVHPER